MKKRFVLPMLLALSVTLLTGCGKQNTPSMDVEDEGDIVRDEHGNVIFEDVELKLWTVTTGDDANTQDEIINQFNTMYNGQIKVTAEHISRYDLETNLTSTMEFDRVNGPDILFNHGNRTTEYHDRGWLYSIEKFYQKADIPLDKDDYVDSLLDATTIDGEMYGTPIDVHSTMMEIRLDILEKNGLNLPTNYAELCALSETIVEKARAGQFWIRGENSENKPATEWRLASTAEDYTVFPIAYGDMWVHEFVGYTAAVQNGADLVAETGLPAWNNEGTIKGLQLLRNWMWPDESSTNKYALSKSFGSDYDVGDAPFKAGTCIFKLQGPWTYAKDRNDFSILLSQDGGASNITTRSISNMFALDNSHEMASKIKGEGHALMLTQCVTSQTKACAAAVFADFLSYYSGITWAKRGHIPAVKSVALSSDFKNDPAYEEFIKYWGNPDDYVVIPPTKYFSYIDTYFKTCVQKAMSASNRETTIQQIVNKEYEDCLAYIDLYA
ncbi:MAG TPA: extracellular solute-binding protein [Candidatus Paceibacterota bacterium]|jgi:ABC-type glycerol-3-phosphate transport system substrate-binding protein|nr:extracellular solute-binding protein [Candidatus Paceibacterota bacterium]